MSKAHWRGLMPRWTGWIMGLAVAGLLLGSTAMAAAPERAAVLKTYADIAQAGYEDSLIAARALLTAVEALIAEPTPARQRAAQAAWRAARAPYMQTEVFRFGNPLVDEWEGKVNAWPLDEGLIDYVDAAYGSSSAENPFYAANVIANASLRIGGEVIDARKIDGALLAETLQEAGGIESNVATGYHAIEFLLWGQDLHGTGPGAGERAATDFDPARCTGGHCERRIAYLRAATRLLVSDLEDMAALWAPGAAAREHLLRGDPRDGIAAMIAGIGSLSYGELAGERMKLGVLLHDPEEEHDCFSDNTHMSHFYDQQGMMNVYQGRYRRIDGSTVAGPALADLVRAADPAVARDVSARMDAAHARLQAIVDAANGGKSYDQLLSATDLAGNQLILEAVDALVLQARAMEQVVAVLALRPIDFAGSDSLSNPASVFK